MAVFLGDEPRNLSLYPIIQQASSYDASLHFCQSIYRHVTYNHKHCTACTAPHSGVLLAYMTTDRLSLTSRAVRTTDHVWHIIVAINRHDEL